MINRKKFIAASVAAVAAPLGLQDCTPAKMPDSYEVTIRNAMLNQTVEVPLMRRELADFLGLKGGRPDLVVRFGRGNKMPQSLRRPLDAVLV